MHPSGNVKIIAVSIALQTTSSFFYYFKRKKKPFIILSSIFFKGYPLFLIATVAKSKFYPTHIPSFDIGIN